MDAMLRKFKAEQILIQNVIPRTQRKPENSVLQCNETHDVKLVVAVIPWACVKLSQNEATGELPGVKYDEIYEDANFKWNTDFFEADIHSLNQIATNSIDKKWENSGIAFELSVSIRFVYDVIKSSEHNFVKETMHAIEEEALCCG